ncbi:MAG: helix-turn-helix domain-containing protein [Myxococcota bacterium]
MARPPNVEAAAAMEAAARRAFAEVGVDAARVEDIARAAGLSKASFYVYFESKSALFASLIQRFLGACQACADRRHTEMTALHAAVGACDARDWATRSPRYEAFASLDHRFTLEILGLLWEWRDMLESLLEHASSEHRPLVDTLTQLTLSTLTERLDEAMRQGFLRRDLDPELASEILLGAYLQLGRRMYRLSGPPDLERWARTVETVLNEGLRPTDAPQGDDR